MNTFPPKAQLQHLVRLLMKHLPHQVGTLLESDRFTEESKETRRLLDPMHLSDAISQISNEEAQWLANTLETRWERIGKIVLEPAVAIVGPDEVWVANECRDVTLDIATLDLDEDWYAEWLGHVVPAEDTKRCMLTIEPITDTAPVEYEVSVRVMGRQHGKRCIQTARHQIRARRPVLEISDDRQRIIVRDQSGAPAGEVEVDIDGQQHTIQKNGLLELPKPLNEGAVVHVGREKV